MNCAACQQPLEDDARFCGFCGREVQTASDLLEGKSLRDIARDEAPLPIDRVLELVRAVTVAVGNASHVGRLDLRPEVIYIDAGGRATLVDAAIDLLKGNAPNDTFSPRPSVGEDKLGFRQSTMVDYASPEKLMGRAVDERSQVYVIGVLAYELAVGRLPFHKAKGPAAMISAQLTQRPDSPSMLRPAISRQFDTFVLGLLQKDPALRPDIPAVLASLDAMGMLDTIPQR